MEIVENLGFQAKVIPGAGRVAISEVSNQGYVEDAAISRLPGVSHVIHVTKPYKLVSRDFSPENTVVTIGELKLGEGCPPVSMAGPCSVESEEQVFSTAELVKKAGAHILRGGAFKPRTGPYNFQGFGEEGLKMLSGAGKANNMLVV